MNDLRSILRLTYEQGLSVRAISQRLKDLGWPPTCCGHEKRLELAAAADLRERGGVTALQRALFRRVGRPRQDLSEPEWPRVAQELKRKGVTLTLLWQEYRTAHPNGYGYTWFCE